MGNETQAVSRVVCWITGYRYWIQWCIDTITLLRRGISAWAHCNSNMETRDSSFWPQFCNRAIER